MRENPAVLVAPEGGGCRGWRVGVGVVGGVGTRLLTLQPYPQGTAGKNVGSSPPFVELYPLATPHP